MPNRLYQGVVHQMKDAIDRVIGVIDENGVKLLTVDGDVAPGSEIG